MAGAPAVLLPPVRPSRRYRRREGRTGSAAAYLHTTDAGSNKPNMQSVIESNDLDEMMAMVGAGCIRPGLVAH